MGTAFQVDSILKSLSARRCVAVRAVPGAGKTHVILACCKGESALILAYNKQLASKMKGLIDAETTTCLTFHSLCSICLAPAKDDNQLLVAVEMAERGELIPKNVPIVTRVLIDEAQDVRELYVRLIKILGLSRDSIGLLVAGDADQLIYNFDDKFPATLDTLTDPEVAFGRKEWDRISMSTSHRLTSHISTFVNAVFGTNIKSTKAGPQVEIRAPLNWNSSPFDNPKNKNDTLYGLLEDVLFGDNDILLLAHKKRWNAPLRTLLNALSRNNRVLKMHWMDGQEEIPSEDALVCGTFWSAKGLEAATVVVLLPGQEDRNPTYVALTRACKRLIVVLDPKDPHPLVSRQVYENPELYTIVGKETWGVITKGSNLDPTAALVKRPKREEDKKSLRDMQYFSPRHDIASDMIHSKIDIGSEGIAPSPVRLEGDVCVQMALSAIEYGATGKIRAVENILHPTRIVFGREENNMSAFETECIPHGFSGRGVYSFVTEDSLLAPDLRTMMETAYSNMSSIEHTATISLAILSWNSWDYRMRSCLPAHSWAWKAQRAMDFVANTIPSSASFDTRLHKHGCHVRVHASTPEKCYHVVWEASTDDITDAGVKAALHPRHICTILEISSLRTTDVFVEEPTEKLLL
jgi:hypothetical protein